MRPHRGSSARRVGLAALLVVSGALSMAARPAYSNPVHATADITELDVTQSNNKVGEAYGALVAMWRRDFRQLGTTFVAPAIARYRGNVRTQCGIMQANNAQYCPQLNAIFFDEVFVARQAKAAANELGTDGDMAAVGIIAHEMGHAVAMQLGEVSRIPYENEARADCLAGAFTQQTARDGSLLRPRRGWRSHAPVHWLRAGRRAHRPACPVPGTRHSRPAPGEFQGRFQRWREGVPDGVPIGASIRRINAPAFVSVRSCW